MSEDRPGFQVGWIAGPSAQIDLFNCDNEVGSKSFQVKYTPPIRSAIRPPVEKRLLQEGELKAILDQLRWLIRTEKKPPEGEVEFLGAQLLTLLVSGEAQSHLQTEGMFLELGIDESLLHLPWELMHDGEDFLCLKHFLGCFINSSGLTSLMPARPLVPWGSTLESLAILIISVPFTDPGIAPYADFPYLEGAEAETNAICERLSRVDGVELKMLSGREATLENVWVSARERQYQIIHFSGMAVGSSREAAFGLPGQMPAGLYLFDQFMPTQQLASMIRRTPPILCFLNSSETATFLDEEQGQTRLGVGGLGRALLDTGAYLLAPRWGLADLPAAVFGERFYASLIEEGKAIGNAVMDARRVCRDAVAGTSAARHLLNWASYVFYGDPRMCFHRAREAWTGQAQSGEGPGPHAVYRPLAKLEPMAVEAVEEES